MRLNADGNITDLVTEQATWSEYKASFPTVLDKLKEIKCPSIDLNDLENFVSSTILPSLGVLRNNQ